MRECSAPSRSLPPPTPWFLRVTDTCVPTRPCEGRLQVPHHPAGERPPQAHPCGGPSAAGLPAPRQGPCVPSWSAPGTLRCFPRCAFGRPNASSILFSCWPWCVFVFRPILQLCYFFLYLYILYLIFLYFFAGVVPAVPHPSCQPPDCKSLYPHPGPWPPAMDHAQHNTQLRWMGKRMLKRRVHTAA